MTFFQRTPVLVFSAKALPLAGALTLWLMAGACVTPRHPLATDGALDMTLDGGLLFAVDLLDAEGHPLLPRQEPHEKRVKLYFTQDGSADRGAFVDLTVSPPQALELVSVDGTCEVLPGTFRCTAGIDGFASLIVRSESTYSGPATLGVLGRRADEKQIDIEPPGLPPNTTNFDILIEGASANRITASYDGLACSLEASPGMPFDKWPAGSIRSRKAEIRASAPQSSSASLGNAPVIVETVHPEAFVSFDAACAPPHDRRLRVQLNALGRSPEFYFCVSDLGGDNIQLTATSGARSTNVTLNVDAEPRLLRIETVPSVLPALTGDEQHLTLKISAYDADLERVGLEVAISSSDKTVILPLTTSLKLLGKNQGNEDATVFVTTGNPGNAVLTVRPLLFEMPSCDSDSILVEEVTP